jgi:hypothetical protein
MEVCAPVREQVTLRLIVADQTQSHPLACAAFQYAVMGGEGKPQVHESVIKIAISRRC